MSRSLTRRPAVGSSVALVLFLLAGGDAGASEASTHFSLFVPPNNSNNGRDSALTITAHSSDTQVTVVDTADDGDSDDSTSATLGRGQSIVVRLRDGLVNDDAGGKWDGDRFLIDSNKPVTAMLSTKSDWQHDWVPAEGQTMRGHEFFVWAPQNGWDIDVVAYEDDTLVEVYEISTVGLNTSGITTVALPGEVLLRQTIQRGEDLLVTKQLAGTNLTKAGHTYRIVASKAATVAFGAFHERGRDGGGYVPSESGTTVGKQFFFPVPAEPWAQHEREIRVVAGDAPSTVTLRGWSSAGGWTDIETVGLPAFGHADFTGKSHSMVKQHKLFELVATENVNVFEANWLETGSAGTSDVISFVSALDSEGASDVGQDFMAYVGPPGHQSNASGFDGTYSHLYVAGLASNTTVSVVDVDTNGMLFNEVHTITEADGIIDIDLSVAEYNALNDPGNGIRPYLRVQADAPVSVGMANWNDNWLAFASGLLPPSIDVTVDGPEVVQCNTSVDFDLIVENRGPRTIDGIAIEVEPMGNLVLVDSPTPIDSLAPSEVAVQTVGGSVSCLATSSGVLVGLSASATGTDTELSLPVASNETSAAPATVPGVVGVVDVVAAPDSCAVEVTWVTDADDGNVEYAVLRREFGSTDPFVEMDVVPSLAPAASGFIYGYRDVSANQGTMYQYMIQARLPAGGQELSIAGPTVGSPGAPFVEIPGKSGNIAVDFASAGIILPDATGDITASGGTPDGYDIDGIGIAYDAINDALYLSASAVGVLGDGDGDGDPNTSTNPLPGGLVDQPFFSNDEQFAFVVDFDGSGTGDAVIGIPFGADLDYLQAAPINSSIGLASPTLAFGTASAEQDNELVVQLLNAPSAEHPDLELVVYNASALAPPGVAIDDIDVSFYLHALSITGDVEWAPGPALTTVAAEDTFAAGCGNPTDQIHLGMFAVFGNVFTGTPDFNFTPLGWEDNKNPGAILADAPPPVPGQVITSPTIFMGEKHVDIRGLIADGAMDLSTKEVRVRDSGQVEGDNYTHISEIDWSFAAAEGDERYENFDLQTFRLLVLDCSATVTITQEGTSGILRDDRFIKLADDSITNLGEMNPANILAHSGLGTFETAGAMQMIHFGIPEDWVADFGLPTAPEFTHYAFLDEVSYVGGGNPPADPNVYPIGRSGQVLEPGIWFTNHYLWTYANEGSTRIESVFVPGPDCGGSL